MLNVIYLFIHIVFENIWIGWKLIMSLKIFQGAKVIVTGHTGFKGSWLSLWLTQAGAKVTGISIDIVSSPSNFDALDLAEHIEDIRADIRDVDALKSIFNSYWYIYNVKKSIFN